MRDGKKRKRYPFLLGTTSYIIPDDIVPNVKMLAPLVDDIELVLFESSSFSNIPSDDCINELRALADDNGCGYTVHLPIDRKAGDPDRKVREGFRDEACRIIDLTRRLSPRAWVLHLEGIEKDSGITDVSDWQDWCKETVSELVDRAENSHLIAIENLSYPAEWNIPLVSSFNTSYCLDIGHLWLQSDVCWEDLCTALLPGTSVVHLHGVHQKRDHLSLAAADRAQLIAFLIMLKDFAYRGVLTMEIFGEKEFYESMEVIDRLWEILL